MCPPDPTTGRHRRRLPRRVRTLILFALETRPRWYASALFWFACALGVLWFAVESQPHFGDRRSGAHLIEPLWMVDGRYSLEPPPGGVGSGWSPLCDYSFTFDGFRLRVESTLQPVTRWVPLQRPAARGTPPPADAIASYTALLRTQGAAPLARALRADGVPEPLVRALAEAEPLWDPTTGRGRVTLLSWRGFPLWMLEASAMGAIALAGLVGLLRELQVLASRHADKAVCEGRCPHCGYSLTELRGRAGPVVCPECGTNMRDVGKLASD